MGMNHNLDDLLLLVGSWTALADATDATQEARQQHERDVYSLGQASGLRMAADTLRPHLEAWTREVAS